MKKIILSLALVATLAIASCNNTQKNSTKESQTTEISQRENSNEQEIYKVDTQQSLVNWAGSKPGKTHTGTISLSQGEIEVEKGMISSASFTIDMSTINVTDLQGDEKQMLEGHLKGTSKPENSDHFFNITQFPTASFSLTKFDGKNVFGNLTIKGKTKEISFPAKVSTSGEVLSLESEKFNINRVDFGVNYASKSVFDSLKDKFINDEIEIQVSLKAKK